MVMGLDHIICLLRRNYYNVNMFCTFSSSVRKIWYQNLNVINHMLNYVLAQIVSFLLINPIRSSPMTRYNWFQSWSGPIKSDSLLHIPLNYSDSDVLPFNFHIEYGERLSQSNPGEYDWLGPDSRKIQGDNIFLYSCRVILIRPVWYLTNGHGFGSHYLPIAQKLL